MTEAEWLASREPTPMLEFLRDKASDRKLQLFQSACLLRIPAKAAVRWEQLRRGGNTPQVGESREVASNERKELARAIADAENAITILTCGIKQEREKQAVAEEEREAQCSLLRDIFGSPFRPVPIDPSWLTYNDGTVAKLAHAIYADRAFDRMPILGDALQEAGCEDADILGHCRQQGTVHARGCWLVDLLTGRS